MFSQKLLHLQKLVFSVILRANLGSTSSIILKKKKNLYAIQKLLRITETFKTKQNKNILLKPLENFRKEENRERPLPLYPIYPPLTLLSIYVSYSTLL